MIIILLQIYSCIGDVINALKPNLCDDTFGFVVRRDHVLNDALVQMDRLAYSPYKKIDVCYNVMLTVKVNTVAEWLASRCLDS